MPGAATPAQAPRRRSTPSRGRPRDGAIDGAVLDATERLLGERGYEAMTVEQVAAAAGVSKPTIYLRYRSKDLLVAAMIDRLRAPLPEPAGASAEDDLVVLIDLQRRWVDRHGLGIVAAVLLEQADHPELLDRFKERVVEPVRGAFARVLAEGVARGELRPGADDGEVIDALTGALWARSWVADGPTAGWPERLVRAVVRGLTAGPAAGPLPGPAPDPGQDRTTATGPASDAPTARI
jgi:AcrR family transcriptional regulator